jgi:purine-binding chemotaxis protein CheW
MSRPESHTPDEALRDYFDSLLDDTSELVDNSPIPPDAEPVINLPPPVSNIATLPAVRPVREPRTENLSSRPYAEPIRTLNLRVPLPAVATSEVITPAPKVEAERPLAPVEKIAPVEKAPSAIAIPPTIADVFTADVSTATAKAAAPLSAKDELTHMSAPPDWLANGRPAWAQQPFECLLFRVGGLALAAPLTELGAIYPLEQDSLTSIFGQSSWFMGLLPVKEYTIRAIDTARVVMPERYEETMRERYRYVISLYGADWGLGVDEVMNSVRLDPDQVRWRGQRSKRPWLAGTVVDSMCALLDIPQLAWLLHNQDRKRRQPTES